MLFPPLLFNSVAHAKLTGLDTAEFLLFGTLAMATGVFMAKAVSKMAPADPMTDASVRQTGYRFNSYICFALALNMYGQEALALVALLTGIWVPISNAIAVADLTMRTRVIITDTFLSFEMWLLAAAVYLVLTSLVSIPARLLERKEHI